MDPQLEQKLKIIHESYLSLGETKAVIKNLSRMHLSILDKAMAESVLGNSSDSQIRMLCAQAKGIKEVLDYITRKYESIT